MRIFLKLIGKGRETGKGNGERLAACVHAKCNFAEPSITPRVRSYYDQPRAD